MSRTLLVVGHGMAGHRLVEEVRRLDTAGQWRIVAVTDDSRRAYDRVALSSYLTSGDERALDLVTPETAGDPLVDLRVCTRVREIDVRSRTAHCADGGRLTYDALVLATGSRPFVPPVAGHDRDGCFVYRTLDDLDALRRAARPDEAGVVVGGGLLGLEAAGALRRLGMRPYVVETAPHPMPLQVDAAGGALLARLVRELGVEVLCGTGVASVDAGRDGRVAGVTLADGRRIGARIVVFASGVRPRDELAASAGLALGRRGGFLVDRHCRTSVPGVWAIGECAAVEGRTYGLLAPGYRMAETVARRLTGTGGDPLPALDTSTRLKLLGVDVAGFGDTHATTPGALEFTHSGASVYSKLVLDADARVLLGGVLVGDASAYPALSALTGRALPAEPEVLLRAP